ncbi:S66 peptidase family protein [Streptomyces sp. NBC_00102]|uniref:S66 family peptidase n=1 Tax=Streptomyces sp. NBC_00102 TaxID=2975652 RepID=UPI0022581D68|nr:S66 peptidase family protein [Streptomyces sp. NBC_00102]MCX5397276.1 LD-carboxypeptidase [Streptomyces sp. NBC_00102]
MTIRYPRPLRPGDRVAVTSPSSGVPERLRGRFDAAVRVVEDRGYEVVVGACMDGSRHVSAPAGERAAEFEAFLTDPGIRAVVPPWGGETAIDVVPLIDWEKVAAAEPTWVVGYSDITTLITPLTLLSGTATVHGSNLMDTPYRTPDGLLSWLDVVESETGSRFTQSSPGRYRSAGWDDWTGKPGNDDLGLDTDGRWTRLDGGTGDVDVTGRLVGGCVETLANLAGSRYLDVRAFARDHAPEGLVVYVEACEDNAFTICRNLHGLRINGFFDHANAVLVGRTSAPDDATMTQHEAVVDALGMLGVPIVADVECGHVSPRMPFVNGALTRVVHMSGRSDVIQSLV